MKRAGLLCLLLLLLPSPGWAGTAEAREARLWFGDIRLRGPLEGVHFDCGEDGSVQLWAHLLAGEEGKFALPFPIRSPLDSAGLSSVPGPRVTVQGEASGSVLWMGWSAVQPRDVELRLAGSLTTRPRPPASDSEARPGWGQLALLAASFLALYALRRRPRSAASLGIVAAIGLGVLVVDSADPAPPRSVIEVDADSGQAIEVRGGNGWLALSAGDLSVGGATGLERAPGVGEIHFELALDAKDLAGAARTPHGQLWFLRPVPMPDVLGAENRWARLGACWTRDTRGQWSARGAWDQGGPLPPPVADGGWTEEPPGWLAAGLPPGRGVLLGRLAGASGGSNWIRVLGFRLGSP